MNQQQLNLDISKTTPILTKDGGRVWQQGFVLRKASRFLTGSDEDQIIPIPIFYDPVSGEICKDGMPKQMDFLFEEEK
jgi:hypothetical protein